MLRSAVEQTSRARRHEIIQALALDVRIILTSDTGQQNKDVAASLWVHPHRPRRLEERRR